MKSRLLSIFDLLAVMACAFVLLIASGCASNGRGSTYKTTVEKIDPVTGQILTETREETHDKSIRATGYKVAFDKIQATERRGEGTSQGPGDYFYELGVGSASASPDSQVLKGFQAGFGLAGQYFGGPGSQAGLTEELQSKLDELNAKLADIEAIAEALEADRAPPQ